jgi:D-serine deaminase-like pyridoxal phosphate-dependent protein
MTLDELYTPCLLVDKKKLTANIERMNAHTQKTRLHLVATYEKYNVIVENNEIVETLTRCNGW